MSEISEDFEDLYETSPCGFVSLSPNGRIVKLNQTLAEWLKMSREELLGRPIHDILGFGGKIAFETHLAPLLRMQGYVYELAIDLIAAGGEKIPAIVNAAEKRDDHGRHLFTRLTLFKAVDRRTYERSLVEARVKAESESKAQGDAAQLRDQFIAVLGHDLRNPIAAIGAGIHMLERREALSEFGTRLLGEMRGSVGRAEHLIANLLDFARGRLGGGIPIERSPEDLELTFAQVVAEIRAIASNHRIEADIAVPEPVDCDAGRIAQLASNLLANAVTHGPADSPVDFIAHTRNGSLQLEVINDGDPIPPELRDRLFQPFIRNQERPSANGLGLGLFIASEVAKAHGGKLTVECSGGKVSFRFSMPVRPVEGPAAR